MIVTEKIRNAILAYVADNGGAMRLIGTLGVSVATAIHIGKGRSKVIQRETWEKLEPLIQPYMPADTSSVPIAPMQIPNQSNTSGIMRLLAIELQKLSEDELAQVYRFVVGLQLKKQ